MWTNKCPSNHTLFRSETNPKIRKYAARTAATVRPLKTTSETNNAIKCATAKQHRIGSTAHLDRD